MSIKTPDEILQQLAHTAQHSAMPAADFMTYLNNMFNDCDQHALIPVACEFIYRQPEEKFPEGFFAFITDIARNRNRKPVITNAFETFSQQSPKPRWIRQFKTAFALSDAYVDNIRLRQKWCCGLFATDAARNIKAINTALRLLSENKIANTAERELLETLQATVLDTKALHSALIFTLYDERTKRTAAVNPLITAAAQPGNH